VTRDEFDALVKRLEEISRRHPRRYIARTVALLALAYGYLGMVLAGSVALIIGTIFMVVVAHNAAVIKLALFILVAAGGIVWAVLRGLWVRLDPPEGQPVTRDQAPKLFALLDELRGALECSPFHHVLLVGELNAAVVQIPRLGVFGWHRNYLLLGLPLMHSLGPDEFKAVLAHEFAHSSRGHGRFGNWLYRLRRSWERIFEQMARQGTRGGFVLARFLEWFWPLFNAHAFVLARANEYEADACSAQLAGADAAARALMRLPVDAWLIDEKFWPEIWSLAKTEKSPPSNVMLALADTLRKGAPDADAALSLRQAFLLETTNGDTHPCLKDRLRAIGRLPAILDDGGFPLPPPPPWQSATEALLGQHAETAARLISEAWREAISSHWAEQHGQTQLLSAELAKLDQPASTPRSVDELWAKASTLLGLNDAASAAPVLDEVLARNPKHVAANFARGRLWLEQEDPRGIACIESALESFRTNGPARPAPAIGRPHQQISGTSRARGTGARQHFEARYLQGSRADAGASGRSAGNFPRRAGHRRRRHRAQAGPALSAKPRLRRRLAHQSAVVETAE
jgi:Zn-dependent protease with chaperone function